MASPWFHEYDEQRADTPAKGAVKKAAGDSKRTMPMTFRGWKAPNVAGTRAPKPPTQGRRVSGRTNEDF